MLNLFYRNTRGPGHKFVYGWGLAGPADWCRACREEEMVGGLPTGLPWSGPIRSGFTGGKGHGRLAGVHCPWLGLEGWLEVGASHQERLLVVVQLALPPFGVGSSIRDGATRGRGCWLIVMGWADLGWADLGKGRGCLASGLLLIGVGESDQGQGGSGEEPRDWPGGSLAIVGIIVTIC